MLSVVTGERCKWPTGSKGWRVGVGGVSQRQLRAWHNRNTVRVFLVVFLLFPLTVNAQIKPIRRVLILNEVGTSYPLTNLVDEGIRRPLANSPYHIEFYREYMDTVLFSDPADQQVIRDSYVRKYKNHRPDVIVTVGSSPLRFMAETLRESFPGVPVVFCFPNAPAETAMLDSDFTGTKGEVDPVATIAAALRLLPDTLHIVVVGGIAPYDRRQQTLVKEELRTYEKQLDISYLTDLTMPVLLEQLRQLPSHTIVLLTSFGRDSAGTSYNANESGPMIVGAAKAPVFSLVDRFLNHGEVGGKVSNATQEGKIAGDMVLRILDGEKPEQVPIAKAVTQYMFDWRALKRWGLKEKDLPPGSIVLNRELSLWEAYKWYFIIGAVVFELQTIAILGLLWQRVRRRNAEAQLRRSEERFSKCFRRSPLVVIMASTSNCAFIEVNDTFELQTGWRRDEVIGRTPADIELWAESDQRYALKKQLLANGNIRELEITVRRKDGQIRTALMSAEVIELNDEQCALAVAADITDRKEAEDMLSGVSRRLIEAHEEERTRIARELHDDINQRLAILAVNLQTLKRELPALDLKACNRIEQLFQDVFDLGRDVQALSHRLHSSKLEILGLEAASASFCKELSEQQGVEINFHSDRVPVTLSSEISLSLFRVLQEALNNAIKYSGVQKFEVSLTGRPNEIRLIVCDSGKGFNVDNASRGIGLGLTSMKERLKLVDGTLSIHSMPQHGTTVLACVPLLDSGIASTGAVA